MDALLSISLFFVPDYHSFSYCPSWERANRSGELEILINPMNGLLISRIRKIALETANALSRKARWLLRYWVHRGRNRQKNAKAKWRARPGIKAGLGWAPVRTAATAFHQILNCLQGARLTLTLDFGLRGKFANCLLDTFNFRCHLWNINLFKMGNNLRPYLMDPVRD